MSKLQNNQTVTYLIMKDKNGFYYLVVDKLFNSRKEARKFESNIKEV